VLVSVEAQVVEQSGNPSLIRLSKVPCMGCVSRCGEFPASEGAPEQITLTVESHELVRMFWYTLGLPLCGFVCGSWLFDALFSSDISALAGGATGLAVGVLACRSQPLKVIRISKAD
jgi:hypothetical protein